MKFFKLVLYLLLFSGFAINNAWATHIRAGDLTAERISTANPAILTYRFTVMLYRDTEGVPAQDGLINFGTGNPDDEVTVSPESLGFINGGTTEVLRYTTTFTFPSAGTYTVSYFERNRNPGIVNMFNSNDTPFYIASTFRINPIFGLNSSPVLTIPPIDQATLGQRFIHNPGAFDADGDSLAYRLTVCKLGPADGENGGLVYDYTFPDVWSTQTEDGQVPPIFTIDPVNGDLIWDAPATVAPGEYNVAFYVEEWRDGIMIGEVNRDMQIDVRDHDNNRPAVATLPKDTCVVAGELLEAIVAAEDADGDRVVLTVANDSVGIFGLEEPSFRATFDTLGLQPPNGYEEGLLSWQTTCNDIRREPYQVTFKAVDLPSPVVNRLADLQTWRIKVVAPPPDTLIVERDLAQAQVQLFWNDYTCGNAERMTVWRKEGCSDFNPVCEPGLPSFTGYEQIGEVDITTTTFLDDNNGQGLERGKFYSYRIYAVFPDPAGGESLASMEVCVFIPRTAPYITNVSVDSTDTAEGEIFVRWTTPVAIDGELLPPPYTYDLVRVNGFGGNTDYTVLATNIPEEDTTFVDTGLNTDGLPYTYRVLLYSQGVLADSSDQASSVRLSLSSAIESMVLDWRASVPWNNSLSEYRYHYIYRKILDEEEGFSLIDSVDVLQGGFAYVDDGSFNGEPLEEGKLYCYKVATYGDYEQEEIPTTPPLINFSQEECDSILVFRPTNAPIITNVSVEETERDEGVIFVRWTKAFDLDTVMFPRPHTYKVARAEGFNGTANYVELPQIFSENDTSFYDSLLNTTDNIYNYRVLIFSQDNLVDSSEVASSVRLSAASTLESIFLSWEADVPWQNDTGQFRYHYIFRKLAEEGDDRFVLIDSVDVTQRGFTYEDNGSFNGVPLDPTQEYCYFVTTQGTYFNPRIADPLLNNSQEACAVLLDVVPPCLPISFIVDSLQGTSCDQLTSIVFPPNAACPTPDYQNFLTWTKDRDPDCDDDLAFYNVYFRNHPDSAFALLASVTDTFYVHENLVSIAGCYTLTTVDLAGNESGFLEEFCVENCPYYELPNVFTPNNDNSNDTFRPFPCPRFVESVSFRVFNRWGDLVHESNGDILLNWDGTNRNGQELAPGLYYYEATVTFFAFDPADQVEVYKGWVKLIRDDQSE